MAENTNTNTNDNVSSNVTPPVEEAKKVVKGNSSGSKANAGAGASAGVSDPVSTLTIAPSTTTPTGANKRLQPAPVPEPPTGKLVTDPDNIYVFIGGECQIDSVRLSTYGMQIRITDPNTLEQVIAGGVSIIPRSVWDTMGFTDDELDKYGDHITHNPEDADITFLKKAVAVRKAFQDFSTPYREAYNYKIHQDSVKRAEESGNARREREAAYHRLLQEYDPAHVAPTRLSPRDMLVNPTPAANGFETGEPVVEVVNK